MGAIGLFVVFLGIGGFLWQNTLLEKKANPLGSLVPPSISKSSEKELNSIFQDVWFGFREMPFSCSKTKDFSSDGEILSYYCKALSRVTFEKLNSLLGYSVFGKGPHGTKTITLNHPYEFGFYNPDFPKFLLLNGVPFLQNLTPTQAKLFQSNYDLYLREWIRVLYASRFKLGSFPEFYANEVERYKTLISEKRLEPFYLEKYRNFLNPIFLDQEERKAIPFRTFQGDAEFSGEKTKTAVGFWIRRGVDGTEKDFYVLVKTILERYDREFLERAELEN